MKKYVKVFLKDLSHNQEVADLLPTTRKMCNCIYRFIFVKKKPNVAKPRKMKFLKDFTLHYYTKIIK